MLHVCHTQCDGLSEDNKDYCFSKKKQLKALGRRVAHIGVYAMMRRLTVLIRIFSGVGNDYLIAFHAGEPHEKSGMIVAFGP